MHIRLIVFADDSCYINLHAMKKHSLSCYSSLSDTVTKIIHQIYIGQINLNWYKINSNLY